MQLGARIVSCLWLDNLKMKKLEIAPIECAFNGH